MHQPMRSGRYRTVRLTGPVIIGLLDMPAVPLLSVKPRGIYRFAFDFGEVDFRECCLVSRPMMCSQNRNRRLSHFFGKSYVWGESGVYGYARCTFSISNAMSLRNGTAFLPGTSISASQLYPTPCVISALTFASNA